MAATCPHCGAKLNLSSAQPGGTIKCSCGKAFRLKPRQATGASATPHSVKSDDPAVCEQCGAILARADARFCPTCGEALGLPGKPPGQAAARPSPTPDTARKAGIRAVLGWVFGVFLVLGGIGGLADGAVVAGVALMFMGLVLLPPVAKAAAKKSGRPFTVGHKVALLVVGFIVVAVSMPKDSEPPDKQAAPQAPESIAQAGDGSSASQERVPIPAAPKAGKARKKPTEARLKDEIRIGAFVYRADEIRFEKTLGNEFVNKTANGVYLLVGLSIMNTSKETRHLDGSMFQIIDAQGNRYQYSIAAASILAMGDVEPIVLKECQPKIPTSGVLVFEVPRQSDEYTLLATGGLLSSRKGRIRLTDKKGTP